MSRLVVTNIETQNIKFDSDTTAFTIGSDGTTTGPGAGNLILLATIDATPNATTYEFSMDYDSYSSFLIAVDLFQGSSTSTGENWDVKFKMDGTLDDGQSTPYMTSNEIIDNGTRRNINNVDNMELVTTNLPTKRWGGFIHCVNFSNNNGFPMMFHELGGTSDGANDFGGFHGHSGIDVHSKQVTAIRYAWTAGNITVVKQKIYGIKQ